MAPETVRPTRTAVSPSADIGAGVDVATLSARLAEHRGRLLEDLADLVRIPSVSAAADRGPVEASAAAVADLLRHAGLAEVSVLRVGPPQAPVEGAPAVVGRRPAPPGAPTVLLYAHHDVQPPGAAADWTTPAFEPNERDGRLFARGAADDKAGILVHLAALRVLGEDLGVGVTVFVEGEEEIGSPTFEAFLDAHRDLLAADVIVVADSGNWRIGVPALTTSLRGLVDGTVEVRTLDHALHSGMYGGAVPDAVTALVRLLATLWDADGSVAVPGLEAAQPGVEQSEQPEYAEADLRGDAGVLDGVGLIGTGPLAARVWSGYSLTVIGIDVPDVAGASNTLQASARAKFSLRVPPGGDPRMALTALTEHLERSAPWGARVRVEPGELGSPWAAGTQGPVYDRARWALEQAWSHPPVHMGIGGSIPFIAALQRVYPDAVVLVTGVEDPDTRAHGTDESLHLAEFERACLAEALLLAALAAGA